MTSQASMWKLGEVRSNAKGGKFLCLEPLFWQSEFAGNPMEPRVFSEGQRPGVSFATDERSRLWERVWSSSWRPHLRRKAYARGRAAASVRQSRGGDWMLKAKLPAHARFWNARSGRRGGGLLWPADGPPRELRQHRATPGGWRSSSSCGSGTGVVRHTVLLLLHSLRRPFPCSGWLFLGPGSGTCTWPSLDSTGRRCRSFMVKRLGHLYSMQPPVLVGGPVSSRLLASAWKFGSGCSGRCHVAVGRCGYGTATSTTPSAHANDLLKLANLETPNSARQHDPREELAQGRHSLQGVPRVLRDRRRSSPLPVFVFLLQSHLSKFARETWTRNLDNCGLPCYKSLSIAPRFPIPCASPFFLKGVSQWILFYREAPSTRPSSI